MSTIGIDARLYASSGIGRYIRNLIKELEQIDASNDYIIFINEKDHDKYKPTSKNFKKWLVNSQWYTIDEQFVMLKETYQAQLDLLHVPHFNIPVFYPRKMMVTVHDLTMGSYSDSQKKQSMFKQYGYQFVIRSAMKKARCIITPSDAVKTEINDKYGVGAKTAVIYEGCDQSLLKLAPTDRGVLRTRLEEMRIINPYFLYVGNAYPHKNLNMLIVAYKEILKQQDMSNMQMAFAGGKDIYAERTAGFSHALGLDKNVIFATKFSEGEYVSERDLAYLYKGAFAYVFPSLKEGFSITPLEAQAFGVPCLISDIPVHKEVFGDSVLYFNSKSNIDLSDKMMQLYRDENLRNELIQKGYENVKRYSWRRMAEQTLEVYKSLLK